MMSLIQLITHAAISAAVGLAGARLRSWAEGMRGEVADIPDHRHALSFALGCLWAVGSVRAREVCNNTLRSPRRLGVLVCVAATCVGVGYLTLAKAPPSYVVINLAALGVGVALLSLSGRHATGPGFRKHLSVLLGALLVVTAIAGVSADGASRWLSLGPVLFQTSLFAVPLLLVSAGGVRSRLIDLGVGLAALGLAMQSDVGMALTLAAAAGYRAARLRDWSAIAAGVAGWAAAAVAVVHYAPPAYTPFVDRLVLDAAQSHPWSALALFLGLWFLLAPAMVSGIKGEARDRVALFSIGWMGIILAATVGEGSTPVVGYGGTAILAYLLSLAAMPRTAEVAAGTSALPQSGADDCIPPARSEFLVATGEGSRLHLLSSSPSRSV